MSASPPIAVKHWHRNETPLRAKTDLRAAAKAVAIRSLRQGLLLGLVPGIEGAAERFITES